jgi:hypothetical protein
MYVHVPGIPLLLVLVPAGRPASRLGRALATRRHFSPAELAVSLPASLDRVPVGLRRGALQHPVDSLRAAAPEAVA